MGDVSEESLLDYFYSTGGSSGRVKNPNLHDCVFDCGCFVFSNAYCANQLRLSQGEKYLVLKKKYRQMLHERDTKHHGTDADGQSGSSPARAPATVQWDATDASASSHPQQDEQTSCGGPDGVAEPPLLQLPVIQMQGPSAQSNGDDELDKDSGSKLDPIEKEWIYSAAGARVPDLSQLLRQDPSLANKKVTALHWAAKHGNKDMASLVANAGADVNTKSVSGYTPLHIAALHGHRHILDLLIVTYGAKENLRDYSGHLACHYLNIKEPEESELAPERIPTLEERNRNRKLVSLFHSKKKWGSAEELAPIEEERTASHQLILPAFRPRKFSR
uniref:Uncharacterized protein n=1 Tax=Sander lucioperca TaxID=283035 RepID=A0A8C9YYU4_SANLU